ncbi:hypothetical protein PFLG_02009 [Plasmodium falciparum RAJ116]|uniref:Pep3/Vps18 beta-propeller domain-containing protein n=1 Tax=Plasmodium falciparum RAJ116 TaxID=580058 RepID=A0A0L0CWH6_PLAFA|nr:hypothetical protein PFLG_02009 [Plasmodium falciparum RAJ116]
MNKSEKEFSLKLFKIKKGNINLLKNRITHISINNKCIHLVLCNNTLIKYNVEENELCYIDFYNKKTTNNKGEIRSIYFDRNCYHGFICLANKEYIYIHFENNIIKNIIQLKKYNITSVIFNDYTEIKNTFPFLISTTQGEIIEININNKSSKNIDYDVIFSDEKLSILDVNMINIIKCKTSLNSHKQNGHRYDDNNNDDNNNDDDNNDDNNNDDDNNNNHNNHLNNKHVKDYQEMIKIIYFTTSNSLHEISYTFKNYKNKTDDKNDNTFTYVKLKTTSLPYNIKKQTKVYETPLDSLCSIIKIENIRNTNYLFWLNGCSIFISKINNFKSPKYYTPDNNKKKKNNNNNNNNNNFFFNNNMNQDENIFSSSSNSFSDSDQDVEHIFSLSDDDYLYEMNNSNILNNTHNNDHTININNSNPIDNTHIKKQKLPRNKLYTNNNYSHKNKDNVSNTTSIQSRNKYNKINSEFYLDNNYIIINFLDLHIFTTDNITAFSFTKSFYDSVYSTNSNLTYNFKDQENEHNEQNLNINSTNITNSTNSTNIKNNSNNNSSNNNNISTMVDMCINQSYIFLLLEEKLIIISNVKFKKVYEQKLDTETYGQALRIIKDHSDNQVWLCTSKYIFKIIQNKKNNHIMYFNLKKKINSKQIAQSNSYTQKIKMTNFILKNNKYDIHQYKYTNIRIDEKLISFLHKQQYFNISSFLYNNIHCYNNVIRIALYIWLIQLYIYSIDLYAYLYKSTSYYFHTKRKNYIFNKNYMIQDTHKKQNLSDLSSDTSTGTYVNRDFLDKHNEHNEHNGIRQNYSCSGDCVSGSGNSLTGSGDCASGSGNSLTGSGDCASGSGNSLTGSGDCVSGSGNSYSKSCDNYSWSGDFHSESHNSNYESSDKDKVSISEKRGGEHMTNNGNRNTNNIDEIKKKLDVTKNDEEGHEISSVLLTNIRGDDKKEEGEILDPHKDKIGNDNKGGNRTTAEDNFMNKKKNKFYFKNKNDNLLKKNKTLFLRFFDQIINKEERKEVKYHFDFGKGKKINLKALSECDDFYILLKIYRMKNTEIYNFLKSQKNLIMNDIETYKEIYINNDVDINNYGNDTMMNNNIYIKMKKKIYKDIYYI